MHAGFLTNNATSQTGSAMYLSTNKGSSFAMRNATHGITTSWVEWQSIACSADCKYIVAASKGQYLWTSWDGGDTWTKQVGTGSRPLNLAWMAVAASASGQRMAAIEEASAKFIYISTDYGANWKDVQIMTDTSRNAVSSMAMSRNGQVIVVHLSTCCFGNQQSNTQGLMIVSTDGGSTWGWIRGVPYYMPIEGYIENGQNKVAIYEMP